MATQQVQDVRTAFDNLTMAEKKEFVEEQKTLLDQPGGRGLTAIWIIMLIVLAGVIFFFGYLGFRQLNDPDGGSEALFGLATLALGAIVGLLAPSPTGGK